MTVFILSASCCYPGLTKFDDQTKRVVEQVASESGIRTEFKVLSGPAAVYSGAAYK